MTSAAGQIWPNLKSDDSPKQAQRAQPGLAAALYPALSPQVKARDDWHERDRQSLLKGLRELNARIDARLRSESQPKKEK